jgi:hypothetical protein
MDDDSPKALRDAAAQIIADANAALEAARLAAPAGTKAPIKPKAPGMETAPAGAVRSGSPSPAGTPPPAGPVRPLQPKPEPPKSVVGESPAPAEPIPQTDDKPRDPPPSEEPARKTGQMLYKEARDKVLAGDEEGGLSLYKQALAAGYAKSHGQLAKLYFGKGDKAGCARHAKAYLERYPDAGDAPQMQTLLEKCQ